MKILAMLLIVTSTLVSGCIVADPYYRGERGHDGMSQRTDRDRDGDGVPNRHDRRPNDERRY